MKNKEILSSVRKNNLYIQAAKQTSNSNSVYIKKETGMMLKQIRRRGNGYSKFDLMSVGPRTLKNGALRSGRWFRGFCRNH